MRFSTFALIVPVVLSFGTVQSSNSEPNSLRKERIFSEKCAIANFNNAFRESKVVFTGKVVKEEKNGDTRTFEFAVDKYWKGKTGKRINIYVYETMRYQAWFKAGESYLVYAYEDGDRKLNAGRCSRSNSLDQAGQDLRKLGGGKKPK